VSRAGVALCWLAAGGSALASLPACADDYEAMLGYLAQSQIQGQSLQRAEGAIAVNQAAGDLNQQSNLRALAVGSRADTQARLAQHQRSQSYDLPAHASAVIGGDALAGASGLASINQASGSGNTEVNVLTAQLGQPGMRGDRGGLVPATVAAPAQRQYAPEPVGRRTLTRHVAVEAGALRGFEGVLQLNQIAGSGNQTGNGFGLTVSP
jgi:hypothetical protein